MPHLSRDRYLRNQTSFHALGAIYKPVKKLKLKAVGYFLPANRQINQRFITDYDPTLGVPDLVEKHGTHKDIRAVMGHLTALYTFSKKMNLKYVGKFKSFPQAVRTYQTFRNRPLNIHLNNHDHVWNQNLKFTRRTSKEQAYQIRLRYKSESKQQLYKVNPLLQGGPFQSNSTSLLIQQTNSHLSYLGADIKYWHKDTTWSWSVRAGGERRGSKLHNYISGEPSFTGSGYWNQYRSFAALTLRKTFFGNLKTHAKLTGNLIGNRANLQAGIDKILFYASPEVGFSYKFFTKQHLKAQYSLNHSLPAFTNLYRGRWLSGYRSIMQGSNLFAVLPSNTFTLLYQFGNWQNDFMLNTTFVYSRSSKSYVPASTITPTYHFPPTGWHITGIC